MATELSPPTPLDINPTIEYKAPEKQPLPTIQELFDFLPKEFYQPNNGKALFHLLIPIVLSTFSITFMFYFPKWFIIPIGITFLGLFGFGLGTIARDCSFNQFTSFSFINYILGILCCLPLLLPFESWKQHDSIKDISTIKNPKEQRWWIPGLSLWFKSNTSMKLSLKLAFNLALLYFFVSISFPYIYSTYGIIPIISYILSVTISHLLMSWRIYVEQVFATQMEDGPIFVRCIQQLSLLSSGGFNVWLRQQKAAQIAYYHRREALLLLNTKFSKERQISLEASMEGNLGIPPVRDHTCPMTDEIDWRTISFLFITPILSVWALLTLHIDPKTFVVAYITGTSGGLGITAGYHRLFAHRAYELRYPLKVLVALLATQTFQGSVFWWCIDHRDHHRYTDTDLDPYNAKRGFFFSHMGWLFHKRVRGRDRVVKCNISDLKADPFLRWQNKYYNALAVGLGFVLPGLICGLGWGDWVGGFLLAGVTSKIVVMHITFCVNSVAHYFGDYTFTDQRTPRDNYFTSFLTFGEGYHNFHHEFPFDYRNGINPWAYDPTKWLIRTLEMLGLAYNVVRYPTELIEKGRIQMAQKHLDKLKSQYDWGPEIEKLPMITRQEYAKKTGDIIVVDDVVYNVGDFLDKHPGGRGYLTYYLGKDASSAFNGGVYNHSNCARNLLKNMAIARIDPNSPLPVLDH